MNEKHNHKREKLLIQVGIVFTVLCVGILFGYFIASEKYKGDKEPYVVFQYKDGFREVVKKEKIDSVGRIVASKKGTKYYSEFCESVEKIKQENRVYFDTEEQAVHAGYEKTTSCLF